MKIEDTFEGRYFEMIANLVLQSLQFYSENT